MFTTNVDWIALCNIQCLCVCGNCLHRILALVFVQVLQLDLCEVSQWSHCRLADSACFFSLFTLASQVKVLLRAILEVHNFCHFGSTTSEDA